MRLHLRAGASDAFAVEVSDDCDSLEEACELFKRLLMAAGYAVEFKDTVEVTTLSDLL